MNLSDQSELHFPGRFQSQQSSKKITTARNKGSNWQGSL